MENEEERYESIIATRQRRSNAGNRLKSLLAAEEPLEDEENIFLEFEGDEEFDPEARDEEEEEEEEVDEKGEEGEDEEKEKERGQGKKRRRVEIESEVDDENFSSSSESSDDEESDQEAGEKELQQQQRLDKKKKKKKMELPFLRKKPAPSSKSSRTSTSSTKKKTSAVSTDLLATERRVSKRSSAVRNKEQVIQRLQEQEARRAQYVAPVIKQHKELTQEERLEEAKITEMRNIASLNMYVEQEEVRRQKQRAAMQAKRVPMRAIIRFVSSTRLVAPRRIFIRKDIDMRVHKTPASLSGGAESKPVDQETTDQGGNVEEKEENEENEQREEKEETKEKEKQGEEKEETKEEENKEKEEHEEEEENKEKEENEKAEPDKEQNIGVKDSSSKSSPEKDTPKETKTEENDVNSPKSNEDQNTLAEQGSGDDKVGNKDETRARDDESEQPEIAAETVVVKEEHQETKVKTEEDEDHASPQLLPVQGPYACRARNTVNLLEFPYDFEYSRQAVKSLLLGPRALRSGKMPAAKSLRCPLTGHRAKYIDPETGVPYGSLEAYRALKRMKNNEYAWVTEFGGVYTGLRTGQRHAKGVPEGFDD